MFAKTSSPCVAPASVVLITLLLFVAGSQPAVGEAQGPQKIGGEVMVKERDKSGEIQSVSIWDQTWGLVGVEMKGKGRQLLAHVGDVIEATGTIDPAKDGDSVNYVIRIKTFKVQTPR